MGLDLTLLPVEHDDPTMGFGHSVLRCDNGRGWYDALDGQLQLTDPPERFHTYLGHDRAEFEEAHYGATWETPYGEPLRCGRAGAIVRAVEAYRANATFDPFATPRNRAVLAYLSQLDERMKIALWWH